MRADAVSIATPSSSAMSDTDSPAIYRSTELSVRSWAAAAVHAARRGAGDPSMPVRPRRVEAVQLDAACATTAGSSTARPASPSCPDHRAGGLVSTRSMPWSSSAARRRSSRWAAADGAHLTHQPRISILVEGRELAAEFMLSWERGATSRRGRARCCRVRASNSPVFTYFFDDGADLLGFTCLPAARSPEWPNGVTEMNACDDD